MIISIDLPSKYNLGIAVCLSNALLYSKHYILEEKYRDLWRIINELLTKYPDADMLLENAMNKAQIESATILRLAGYLADRKVYTIHPSTARKIILGSGKAKKEATREWAERLYPGLSQHEQDALLNFYAFRKQQEDK